MVYFTYVIVSILQASTVYKKQIEIVEVEKVIEVEVEREIEVEKEYLGVCSPESIKKTYMDYRAVTNTNSTQYSFLSQCNKVNGMLLYENHYVVAMSQEYGDIGTKLNIQLSSGSYFPVVIGDFKHEGCTSSDGSMIEFIVDTENLDSELLQNNFDIWFSGKIISIERVRKI